MAVHLFGPPKLGRYHLLEGVSSKTFTPREYQVELLDTARKKNSIVCLRTGAGKTFIAVMLIKELAHQVRHSLNAGGKRTVFLVPTGPLIQQQSKVIQDYTDLKVGRLFCIVNSQWAAVWRQEIESNNVIVSTPDIFKMILHHGFISLSEINLLIFDECHKAVRNHSYCEIMACFDVCSVEEQPRILGLSASLINNKCSPANLGQAIQNLEITLRSSVETASEITMLSKYGSKPREFLLQYQQYDSNAEHLFSVLAVIDSTFLFLDDLNICWDSEDETVNHPCKQPRQYLAEISHVILTLGPWCAVEATSLLLKEMYVVLDAMYSDAHRMCLMLVVTALHRIASLCRKMLKEMDTVEQLLWHSPPKLSELLKLLKSCESSNLCASDVKSSISPKPVVENVCKNDTSDVEEVQKPMNCDMQSVQEKHCTTPSSLSSTKEQSATDGQRTTSDTKSLCGVIFVHQRITAYLLNLWLSELSKRSEDYKFISSSYIIGHGKTKSRGSVVLPSHKQEEILKKFKSREYNILVTTSVLEEGLDIPKCNLVVRFDAPENFCAYVQSKGRARASDSLFVLMVSTDNKEKFIDDLCDFKTIEEMLLEKSHRSDIIDDGVKDQEADVFMEPFMPVKGVGLPRVTMSSSIALVNRYCAKLPSDTFTRLTPKWKVKEILVPEVQQPMYECVVQMPINSPLKKPITGKCMRSKQLAKMTAALKTCKELHAIGELDNNLLPTGKEAMKFEEEITDGNVESETTSNYARPGTTKRRQYYFKQVADALKNSTPKAGQPSYLYLFRMVLTCPLPEEQNTRGRKLHDPASTPRSFGILLSKQIPPICSFPVFTRSGEVTVHIEELSCNLFLDNDQLEQLSYFQKYTFSDVLRLEKYPMRYSPCESEFSFYIVPVNEYNDLEGYCIDWAFVKIIHQQKGVKPRKLCDGERQFFQFVEEDYADAVVMPWYRNLDKPQFFYVAEICSHLTPLSNFPDEVFETFKGYYETKYTISIKNCSQPLLDVDHTSARLNLLTPRYVNRKGVTLPTSSESTKKCKRENLQQKQILIPELCIIHPFPASLWRKAVCLPCILYRTNSLLLAEQIRSSVAQTISVGLLSLSPGFQWPVLDFGWTLADVIKAQTVLKNREESRGKRSKNYVKESNDLFMNSNNTFGMQNVRALNNSCENEVTYPADFEIDVFDPSKCDIPDDDELLEQELCNINFGDSFLIQPGESVSTWQPSEFSNSVQDPVVRYGSPSNFENSQWDFEWDVETEDKNFSMLNLPGLGYISGPGAFNMESLSMDLAAQRENYDCWDSLDENSSADELEFEDASPKAKEPQVQLSELRNIAATVQDNTELCESEWLSVNFVKEGSLEQEEIFLEESVLGTVASMRQHKKNEIKFWNTVSSNDTPQKETELSPIHRVLSVMKQVQCYRVLTPQNRETGILSIPPVHKSDLIFHGVKHADEIKNEPDSTLPFGELLRNREEHSDKPNETFQFRFDDCPDLSSHPGPSPSIILQAFTMSNANDGINLERLETVGDSFLKYAITAYLYSMYPNIHEGKLSFLRSKQISNLNLYRLGKRKCLGELMVATKFEPNDNWLPPCYVVPKGLEQALIESGLPVSQWNISNISNLTNLSEEEIRKFVLDEKNKSEKEKLRDVQNMDNDSLALVPYNLLTQHSIPDKSIADCVEALIGAYLVSCGSRGALLFMSWLGLYVLPRSTNESGKVVSYGHLEPPPSPLLSEISNVYSKLERLLSGYAAFERKIGYTFNDKSYLLQAFTHASYHYNTLTDCYQRLEFLGDAVLDYLITRHLYEDPKKHSPGTLTDLRSALVNNTFFASLAVKYDFHKYFKAISPSLFCVINKFVELKEHSAIEDYAHSYYLEEDECEEVEEVEVPKALGDIFESVAGAVYLDSNMSLDTVWKVYYSMMKPEIEYFSNHVPKSPIRELLELEPQTAKFEKAEMTLNGKVRVRVEVFGKGHFVGIGRNKRIAKCTAAKRALRDLKKKNGQSQRF